MTAPFSPQIRLNLSTRFVMDAALSPDGSAVALATMGLNGDTFESRIEHYRLERTAEETDPDWACSLGNDLVLALRWSDNGIWALGETGLSILSPDGETAGFADYGGLYLKDFSLEGDGTAALLLGRYRAGTSAQLQVFSPDGAPSRLPAGGGAGPLPLRRRAVCGPAHCRPPGYLRSDLENYSTLDGTQGAQKVLQQSDGSAMLIANAAAWLYLPQ